MIKMIKILLVFCLFFGCAPYLLQNTNYVKNSCLSECKFRAPEFDSINALCNKINLFPDTTEITVKKYSQQILSFFKNSQKAFVNRDSILLSINYQSFHQIACHDIWEIKDPLFKTQIIKNINDSIFKNVNILDTSLEYCIEVEGMVVKKKNEILFDVRNPNYNTIGGHGRSKAGIMRTVMKTLPSMRYAYNKFLREQPGIKGKLTIRFIINQTGDVIFAEAEKSTLGYCDMEKKEFDIICLTKFEKIEALKNLTTVVYPFVFSQ
jgi:hypothetical protein